MAVAPLNTYKTIAVPVAPGNQLVYTVPVGVSAILLYAQVANVASATTSPNTTLTFKRNYNITGNTIQTRIIKNGVVYPNDTLVIIDGRLVLENTAIYTDSLVLSGNQVGIVSVYNCTYNNTTGITTVTTTSAHNFNVGDQITMSGLAFTCSGTTGLTTTIYPYPQTSFTVTNVGTSTIFTTQAGVISGIAHTYVSGGLVGPLQMEFVASILENSTA
jgi:hypothetical protein